MKKTIAIASDHAGYRVKEDVKDILKDLGLRVMDFGTNSDTSVDYPDYGKLAVQSILDGKSDQGILVCGSGIGMSIVANRNPGIRAALVSDIQTAEMSRLHNNANVLVLPGWKLHKKDTEEIVKSWLNTEFEGGRHQRRLEKIDALEEET